MSEASEEEVEEVMKKIALSQGVELLLVSGKVQAKEITRNACRRQKRYPGDERWQSWTLAETITFVFGKGGCFNDALKEWYEEME